MLEKLTTKQEVVLTFIKKYIASHGISPTIREICDGVGLSSPSTVLAHVENLKNKGYLTTIDNKCRTIRLLVDNEYLTK